MNFKETAEINKKGIRGKSYDTDKPLGIDDIIDIIKGYETEDVSDIPLSWMRWKNKAFPSPGPADHRLACRLGPR